MPAPGTVAGMAGHASVLPETFEIAGHAIGRGRCFVIAEAGVNHNGDPARALALVDAAAEAGADAVKFQTFRAEQVTSACAPKAAYQKAAGNPLESQLEMIRGLELEDEHFAALRDHCRHRGILFLSTPFDHASVALLRGLEVPAFKVPSGEITNLPLVRHIGGSASPVILSSGMADMGEVARAVAALMEAGCPALAILHCVSNYPAAPEDTNLRAMASLRAAFGVPVGLSDHSTGIEIPLAAGALGAAVIEKHFTLDQRLPGPDHAASLTPKELKDMVAGIRKVEAAMGDGVKAPRPAEADTRQVARRSLFLRAALGRGHVIAMDDIVALRPEGGIAPYEIASVVGRRTARDLAAGSMLRWEDLT